MAYLIVAFPLLAGSLLTREAVFIASAVFFLMAALISASMATSREQQLRSLLDEADHRESN